MAGHGKSRVMLKEMILGTITVSHSLPKKLVGLLVLLPLGHSSPRLPMVNRIVLTFCFIGEGGTTWNVQTTLEDIQLKNIRMFSSSEGFAVGK